MFLHLFLQVKSKFDAEFRRFSLNLNEGQKLNFDDFRTVVESLHGLQSVPFTLCYTSSAGDLLPITNDEVSFKWFVPSKVFRI